MPLSMPFSQWSNQSMTMAWLESRASPIGHFHLLKSDGSWQIISKLYRGESIAPVKPAAPKSS
jgi:hypothetical protein